MNRHDDNHDAELRQGGREFHHMLTATNPDDVKLCLDAHWIYRGCGDSQVAVFDAPLLMQCPELLPKGRVVTEMAANIDIAPTVLAAAGVKVERPMHGRRLLPLASGETVENWRAELLYEYFWERLAPSTPTLHALVTPRWEYVRAYGLWDVPELYDLEIDPNELTNLFNHPGMLRRLTPAKRR